MTDSQVSISSLSETIPSILEIPEIVITDLLGQSHTIYLKSPTRLCLEEKDYKLEDFSLQIILPNFKSNKTQIIMGKGENKLILAENETIQFVLLFETKLSEVFYNQILMQLTQLSQKHQREIYYILFNEWSSHQTEIIKHSSHVDVLKYYMIDFLYQLLKIDDSIYYVYQKFFMKTPENKDNVLFISRYDKIHSNENEFMLKILYQSMTATTENGFSLLLDFTDEKFTDKDGKQISQKKHLKNLLESFDFRHRDEKGKKNPVFMSSINEAQLTPIFKILKSIIKVVKGFSGSMYETPIPSCSYYYDCDKFKVSNISTLLDMMKRLFFRSIGVITTSRNFLFLISSLSMSILNETDEKYISLKPVFENFMKDQTFFEESCEYNILNFNTFYQWKLLKFFEKINGKTFNKLIENSQNSLYFKRNECAVFLYLFTEWWKSSSLKSINLTEIATIFGLHNYVEFILGHEPIKLKHLIEKGSKKIKYTIVKKPENRSCIDWLSNITIILSEERFPKVFIPCSSLEITSDYLPQNYDITRQKMEEQLDLLKEFLTKKSFDVPNCYCCGSDFTSIEKTYWHTFQCTQCIIPPKICMDCYNKTTVSHAGHQLNPQTSGICCMQCNFIFPENISRFPEETTQEQIRENSAEYFSCCFIGCNNFVHIPAVEGAICGVETGVITNTFCETHTFLLTMKDKAKSCPNCGIIITKAEGCNHMTCRCGTEFCFCKGCHYFINGAAESYNHPPYCRFGIPDVLTVSVFNYIFIQLFNSCIQTPSLETAQMVNNTVSVISQCLYYISSNGIQEPLISSIYQLQQLLSSSYSFHAIPDLVTVMKPQLNLLFGTFTNQEMLEAIQESSQENNSTLFDDYISYLLDSINSPVQVDDSARTPDGRLIEIPSSDEEDDDEYVAPPPLEPLIHHQIDDQVHPPLLPQVQIQQENDWVPQENDWAQQNIDWGIESDDEDVQAINVALLQQFAENPEIPPRLLEDAPLPIDNSTSDEDDEDDDDDQEDQENPFDSVDENDDEILERAIEHYRNSHY